jgi:pyridoxamine 5'-phosphate oxidase
MPSRPSVTGEVELDLPEFDRPPADPMPLLVAWADRAERLGVLEPYNMAIATVDGRGDIANRFVLAKSFDTEGVTFATNSSSLKGRQLAEVPRAAVVLYWREIRQQVRLTGAVGLLAAAESDAIWADRPVQSQAASTASEQSALLEDDAAYRAEAARLAASGAPLPRPADWNGYRLRPDALEFWHGGADRMHRRLRYDRTAAGWTHRRLYP